MIVDEKWMRPLKIRKALARFVASLCFLALAAPGEGFAEAKRGQYAYGAEHSCVAAAKISAEQCANAAANAQASFEERAPRFPSRDACEKVFPQGGCSVGFSGGDGWAGKKSGVYFSPRQSGFRVTVNSDREISVVPFLAGPAIDFPARSALKRDTHIDFKTARQSRENWRANPSGASGAQFGVATPSGTGSPGALPPPPPLDPNFDCAAVLEPDARDSAATGCYPVSALRRH